MLIWRLAATLWLFRWIFRDPKVDVRFLFAGVLLPDVIDLIAGTVLFPERFATGELWGHSLLLATVYMAIVLAVTRRGRRRRAFMAIGVAWLLHLLIDGMWTDPEILFWPFFGVDLAGGEAPFWPSAWDRAMSDPWRWALEAIGVVYLVWLWFAVGLNEPERRRRMVESGRIPEYVDV
jgi:hypothetical protein